MARQGLERSAPCMARPGIILYGFDPSSAVRFGLFRPVMKLKTVVSMVKELQPGQSTSYGRRFTAETPTRDRYPLRGLRRRLSPPAELRARASWRVHGKPCPVVGRVCMDQLMVDVTDVPDVHEGDEAILWGGTVSDSAEDIARKTDTISYEVLCGVARRVPRVYLEHGEIMAVEDWILEQLNLSFGGTNGKRQHPQFLHHCTHRPRQIHPVGPYSGADQERGRAHHGRPDPGQHGHRAGARHHHQGPRRDHELHRQGRQDLRVQPHRHPGPCGLCLRGEPQSGRLRGCHPGGGRHPGRGGPDAGQHLHGAGA